MFIKDSSDLSELKEILIQYSVIMKVYPRTEEFLSAIFLQAGCSLKLLRFFFETPCHGKETLVLKKALDI